MVVLNSLPYLLQGWWQTLVLASSVVALALTAGTVLGCLATSRFALLRWAMAIYVNLIRGVPVLIFLFLAYFTIPAWGIRLPDKITVILALAIYGTALILENVRGALEAVGPEQRLAAIGLGMNGRQVLMHVTAPQAIEIAMPLILNTTVHLIKCTAFVSIVGVWELSYAAREITERTLAPFQIMLTVMFMYYLMCFPLGRMAKHLETKAQITKRQANP